MRKKYGLAPKWRGHTLVIFGILMFMLSFYFLLTTNVNTESKAINSENEEIHNLDSNAASTSSSSIGEINPYWVRISDAGDDDNLYSVIGCDYAYTVGTTWSTVLSNNIFLQKYDSNGNVIWSVGWGGSEWETGYDLESYNGHIYVIGFERSNSEDYPILLKYDTNGNLIWWKTWRENHGHSYAIDIYRGYIYIAGYAWNDGTSSEDSLLLKYDVDGNLIWSRMWGGSGSEYSDGIDFYGGYIYLAGETDSYGYGSKDMFILKYDTNGNLIWWKTLGGSGDDVCEDVVFYGWYVYAVGYTNSIGAGDYDILVWKVDTETSSTDWYKVWGSTQSEIGDAIDFGAGYIYVAGHTNSYGSGSSDVILLKYEYDTGNLVLEKTWGKYGDDRAYGIHRCLDYLYIVGSTTSYGNGWDGFLLKCDLNGGGGNQNPIADAGGDYYGNTGQTIAFDGSGSYDPDGSITQYDWKFYDGDSWHINLGSAPTYTYNNPGTYIVTLKVHDNNGATDTDTTYAYIQSGNQPPVASFTYSPSNPTIGETITFDASSSYDPDGDIVGYRWDWNGDGAWDTGWLSSPITTHIYSDDGDYLK